MNIAPFPGLSLVRAKDLAPRFASAAAERRWSFESMAGRLTEISEESASGSLSFVVELIRQSQACGRGVVWVAGTTSIFYPLDFAQAGIALDCLPVVWALGKIKSLLALELLVRSGAFGLLLVDLGPDWRINDGSLGRVLKLVESHGSAVIFLTRKQEEAPSIGSLISLRAVVTRSGMHPFVAEVRVTKNKHHANETPERKVYHGPSGMY